MVTILLADDHLVMRQGLRALLEVEPDFRIIGETGDGLEVLSMVEHLQPDILVLDLLLPGIGGMDITQLVKKQFPTTKVVILSMYSSVAYVAVSLSAGAKAYIPKKSTAEELVHAIREVAAGRQYISTYLSKDEIEIYQRQTGESLDRYEILTRREREVLHLVGEGKTSAEIAERLFISPRTVDMHRRHLARKLGLSGQAAMVRYALQHGIISLKE